MKVHERGFSQADLARIFAETDVLVAPSIWYETFGFTVLEAISYGVPVIVSDHVGAKDIIGDGGLVVPAGSAAALTEALEGLDIQTLKRMRDAIKRLDILDWRQHVEKIYNIYTEVYS